MGNFEHIPGLIAAPVSPLNGKGEVKPEIIATYADLLHRNGVAGAFVNGTTGEGLSLTTDERKLIAKAWVDAAPAGFKVIIHVGHTNLESSQLLAKHAQDIGAWGVASIGSIFFKPGSPKDLADWCRYIANSAPNLPFYYYHIPSLTGINMSMFDFIPHAAQIPNFAGIKYTFETMMDYAACQRYEKGKYDMLFGRDEMFLPSLTIGAKGAVGSTYNAFAPLYIQIMKCYAEGNLAEATRLQLQSQDMIMAMSRTGNFFAALKAMMKSLGVDCGLVRVPQVNPPPEKISKLFEELENLGFSDVRMK